MIEYKTGNILKENVEALINTVNCVGIMGRGLALQFKKSFPDNFEAYERACENKEIKPGKMFIFNTDKKIGPRYIINFPTKRHWRGDSRIEDIESGLNALAQEVKDRNISSIAMPPLGCGLGGLDWNTVKALIEKTFIDLSDVRVVIFEPKGSPAASQMQRSSEMLSMTPGRAALVSLMDRYFKGLMDPFISLLELHKLMYFMQEAGEKLRLTYKKAPYGPYAENLRHVLHKIEGHMILGYGDGGDDPHKQLSLIPAAIGEANHFLQEHTETINRFDKVVDLVDGFETPFGLELLATVHWVATKEGARSQEDVIRKVYSWGERKEQFTARQISLAYERLKERHWVT